MANKLDLKLLPVLKEKIIKADDFKQPLTYFYDHFEDAPGFVKLGRDAEDISFLLAMLAKVGEKLLQREAELVILAVREIPEYHFMHGIFTISGLPARVLYFSDVEIGLLAVPKPNNPQKEMAYVRFTGAHLYPSGKKTKLH